MGLTYDRLKPMTVSALRNLADQLEQNPPDPSTEKDSDKDSATIVWSGMVADPEGSGGGEGAHGVVYVLLTSDNRRAAAVTDVLRSPKFQKQ